MKSPWLVALTVTLISMMELLDVTIVNVAIPSLMGSYGASVDEISWVSTGYIVANVVILPASGWLSAWFGRRAYYLVSSAVFVVASLGCALSVELWQMVLCRVVQGLAGGGLLGISQAIIYDVFPKEKVSAGMAVYGVGVMMGPTLGPSVGGYLIDAFSWHWIFLINLPIGAVALLLAWLCVDDSRHERRPQSIDYLGFTLLALGVGSLQILLERGEHWDWLESDLTVLCLVLSALGLVGFCYWERRVANPIVNLSLFANREFLLGSICAFCVGFGLYSTLFMVPLLLQTLLEQSAYQSGLVIFPGALASAVSTLVIGKLSQENRIDERVFICLGILIYGYAMYLHTQFTLQSNPDTLFWPLVIRGFGLGMIFVPLTNLAMRQLPQGLISVGSGVLNLMRQLGGSVGIAIAATLLTRFSWSRYRQLSEHVDETRLLAGGWEVANLDPRRLSTDLLDPGQANTLLAFLEARDQAQMLGFSMLFGLLGAVMLVGVPMVLMMRNPRTPKPQPAKESATCPDTAPESA
ncbi:DHA2 family efflux MFS transporter permease subunit [Pseudomonas entomophila]|uniref:DHA2 family efflux MFS transporter permease subunit n=1 Tax=Pseudomonas entomophila TaxID=312306 RepID=UPI001BD076EA|nr:DHA2 family efflux MFS transporter permease subunit [Pseudomonas entomophila]QVM92715.1 DHA2 family efflux MFS transporter permease subunit [Pseudomonas entomophila]